MTTVKFQNMSDCLFSGAHNRTTLLWPEFAIFLFYPRFLLYPPNPHDHYSCLGFVTPILFSSFRTNFAASVHTFPPLLPRQNHFQSRCRGVQSLFARSFRHSPDKDPHRPPKMASITRVVMCSRAAWRPASSAMWVQVNDTGSFHPTVF